MIQSNKIVLLMVLTVSLFGHSAFAKAMGGKEKQRAIDYSFLQKQASEEGKTSTPVFSQFGCCACEVIGQTCCKCADTD